MFGDSSPLSYGSVFLNILPLAKCCFYDCNTHILSLIKLLNTQTELRCQIGQPFLEGLTFLFFLKVLFFFWSDSLLNGVIPPLQLFNKWKNTCCSPLPHELTSTFQLSTHPTIKQITTGSHAKTYSYSSNGESPLLLLLALLSLCSVIYTHNHHSFPCWSWMEANRQEYMLPSLMVVGVNPLHHLSSLYNAVCWVRRW